VQSNMSSGARYALHEWHRLWPMWPSLTGGARILARDGDVCRRPRSAARLCTIALYLGSLTRRETTCSSESVDCTVAHPISVGSARTFTAHCGPRRRMACGWGSHGPASYVRYARPRRVCNQLRTPEVAQADLHGAQSIGESSDLPAHIKPQRTSGRHSRSNRTYSAQPDRRLRLSPAALRLLAVCAPTPYSTWYSSGYVRDNA
jgi:hypothetical protein